MKKYILGSWCIVKNYLFTMIFFYIFIVGFHSKAALFSIATFIILIPLIYYEMTNYAGVDKRKYGNIRPYEGVIYGFLAVVPFVIIQILILIILPHLNLSFYGADVDTDKLKLSLVKAFVAPMLFIPKLAGYSSVWGYAAAWLTMVLSSFLGYFSGYMGFDLGAFCRQLFGLQPRKKSTTKRRFRI